MGPLEGLTVIEMAGLGPVPFCGMMLADLGARGRYPGGDTVAILEQLKFDQARIDRLLQAGVVAQANENDAA
jgi:crotonobetainyl-CoA:carnitine CoA-transferase CaiB-like acyl-CoA transferase